MGHQHRVTEPDLVTIVKHAVHLGRRIPQRRIITILEIALAPPDSTTGTSASMTMYFAPVSFLISALLPSWSKMRMTDQAES